MSKLNMNMGSQSISGESQGFGEYRYQKALKEISKLINVNRQIKSQSERYKHENSQLQNRLQEALQNNSTLQNNIMLLSNEYQTVSREYQKLSQQYMVLEDYCKKAEQQQQQYMQNSELETRQKQKMHQKHLSQIEQISERYHVQVNELANELRSKQGLIDHLEQKLGEYNRLEYLLMESKENEKKVMTENGQLRQENDELKTKMEQLIRQISTLQQRLSNKKADEQLTNKLRINQQWIKSLNQQNYNLKQKLLQQEYKKQRQRCNQTIFQDLVRHNSSLLRDNMNNNNNNISSNGNSSANQLLLMKEYIKQIQRRIKKSQEQKVKLNEKLNKLKVTVKQYQVKNISLEKQVGLLVRKVNGYEILTERQQKQIEIMIEQYHKEMHKILLRSSLNRAGGNIGGNVGGSVGRSGEGNANNVQSLNNLANLSQIDLRKGSDSLIDKLQTLQQTAYKDAITLLTTQIDTLKTQNHTLKTQNDTLRRQKDNLLRQLDTLHRQKHIYAADFHAYKQRQIRDSAQVQSLRANIQSNAQLILYLQQKVKALQQQKYQILRSYRDLQIQLSTLKQQVQANLSKSVEKEKNNSKDVYEQQQHYQRISINNQINSNENYVSSNQQENNNMINGNNNPSYFPFAGHQDEIQQQPKVINVSTLQIQSYSPSSSYKLLKTQQQSVNKSQSFNNRSLGVGNGNNNKVFVINGKKYQAVVLKNNNINNHGSSHSNQSGNSGNNNNNNINNQEDRIIVTNEGIVNGSNRGTTTIRPCIHSVQKQKDPNGQRA